MRRGNLSVAGLQNVRVSPLQDSGARAGKSRGCGKPGGMLAEAFPASSGFEPHHLYIRILAKGMEQADGVGAAAYAGNQDVGQALLSFQNLLARFMTDARMEIAHHHGIGMGAQDRTEQVM